MVAFVDEHRDEYGVEPICAVLPIAPSTYYEHVGSVLWTRRSVPRVAPTRCRAAHAEFSACSTTTLPCTAPTRSGGSFGEHIDTARCTVERLMRGMGLRGAVRGRAFTVTTRADRAAVQPPDLVHREFTASRPNQLWVADITYVATWVDGLGERVVVRVADRADRALESGRCEALGVTDRRVLRAAIAVDDSSGGIGACVYRLLERVECEVGLEGTRHPPTHDAARERVDDERDVHEAGGLYKTELIRRRGPWRNVDGVEYATLEWVDWFNN